MTLTSCQYRRALAHAFPSNRTITALSHITANMITSVTAIMAMSVMIDGNRTRQQPATPMNRSIAEVILNRVDTPLTETTLDINGSLIGHMRDQIDMRLTEITLLQTKACAERGRP